MLLAPLAPFAISVMRSGAMTLAIHQNTSASAGYRKSLEAGRADQERRITAQLLDDFPKTDSLAAADVC
jgi:hypothetical protein